MNISQLSEEQRDMVVREHHVCIIDLNMKEVSHIPHVGNG